MNKPTAQKPRDAVVSGGGQSVPPAKVAVDLTHVPEPEAVGFANRCAIIEHPTYWEVLLYHASPAGDAAVARLVLPLDLAYGTLVLQSEDFARTLRSQIGDAIDTEKFIVASKKAPSFAGIVPVLASLLTMQQAGMSAAISAYYVSPSSLARARQSSKPEDMQIKGYFTIQVPVGVAAQLIEFALAHKATLAAAAAAASARSKA